MENLRKPANLPLFDPHTFMDLTTWNTMNTHDPGIFKDKDYYYVFSTDAMYREGNQPPFRGGVQVRRSKDLIDWEWLGYVLEGVPERAKEWTGAEGLWAPDMIVIEETYFLYYCASKFGSRQSFIGVATAPSVEGPWIDQGEVIKTAEGDQLEVNAIDPNVISDKEGRLWMVYGSFFGGIYIAELDKSNGKLLNNGVGTLLARRERKVRDGAVEGPYIVYQPNFDYYYLFLSYDSLSSNYNVRVARSRSITGPYTDNNGRILTDTEAIDSSYIGLKLLGGYRFTNHPGWLAPGHNSVLKDDGAYYMVHHARTEVNNHCFHLHVREIMWTEDGWPTVSPERYAGKPIHIPSSHEIPGEWEWIIHDPASDIMIDAVSISLGENGIVENDRTSLSWRTISQGITELQLPSHRFSIDSKRPTVCRGMMQPAWDWENDGPCIVFTGLTDTGFAIWGKQIN
jgi:arabinan endo-1,5-alpha-L-arabinosidase